MGPKKEAYYNNSNPEDAGGPGAAHEAYHSNGNPADPEKRGQEAYHGNNTNPDDEGKTGFYQERGNHEDGRDNEKGY